jgi:gliding motility-associated-like protein
MRYVAAGALSLLITTASHAQLTVLNNATPAQLVQNVLLGEGVTAFNILYNGVPTPPNFQLGRGSFTSGTTNLGLASGVVLSSGNVLQLPGFANFNMSTALNTGSDPDLVAIAGGPVNDRSVLQFDFIPTGDTLRFRYVFGSEEYPEYVCSFNDAFGFFLSGPGIVGPYQNGAINIARLPNGAPVTINNVNNGLNNNPNTPGCPAQNPAYYVNNLTGTTIRLDGFTTVLEAMAVVQCGQTYRIKLAIADAGDTGWDSAVFLEAGSFAVTGTVSAQLPAIPSVVNGNTMIEGCGPYEITFSRSGDVSESLVVDLTVGGTATPGVDYTPAFPSQLVFPAGSATATVTLNVPIDPDPLENIQITIIEPVECGVLNVETQVELFIDGAAPLQVTVPPVTAHCDESVVLAPVVSGGFGGYGFIWGTNETSPTITVSPGISTSYSLTVSAVCGADPVTVDFPVTVPTYPPLSMSVPTTVEVPCTSPGGTLAVTNPMGGHGTYSFTWTQGGNTVGTGPTLNVTSPGAGNSTVYTVTMTDACGSEISQDVTVSAPAMLPLDVTLAPYDPVLCAGQTLVLQITSINGGGGQNTVSWTSATGQSLGSNMTLSYTPTASGPVQLTVNDQCGLVWNTTIPVQVNQPSNAGSNGAVVLCNTGSAVQLMDHLGGTPQTGGSWSGPSATGGVFNPGVHTAGAYTYTVPGLPGCPDVSATVNVTVNTAPSAGINGSLALCGSDAAVALINSLGGNPGPGGTWTGPSQTNGTFHPATHLPGTYTYTLNGVAPCPSASATVQVSVVAPPNAGTNATVTLCSVGAPVSLFDELGGAPQSPGTWSGPSVLVGGMFNPAVHQAGTYVYTVAGQGPCADATAHVLVNVLAQPHAGYNGSATLCTTDGPASLFNALEGSPQTGGTWSGPSTLVNGQFDPAVHAPGSYTYTVSAPAPCVASTATVQVAVNTPANAGTNGSVLVCSSDAPVALFNALGGSPQSGGSWSGPGTVPGGNFNPATGTPGLYTYTVASPTPCPAATATVSVVVSPATQPGVGQTLHLCASQSAVDLFGALTGTATPGGSWTGPAGVMNGIFDPATDTPGTYTYTVAGIAPCPSASASHIITVTQVPIAGGSSSLLLCPGTPAVDLFAQLTGAPQSGGSWSGPGGANNGTFTPGLNTPGVYTYTVSNGPACPPATATVTVTVPSLPQAFAGNDAVFCTMSGQLAASANWASGTWSHPPELTLDDVHSPTSGISTAIAGTYTLTWNTVSADGCTGSDQVQVTFTPPMSATVTASPATCHGVCNGQASVQATGGHVGPPGYQYLWSGGLGTSAQAVNICAGVHQVTVTDMNGCSVVTDFVIVQPEPVAIDSVIATRVTCVDDCDGTLLVSAPQGMAYSLNGGQTWQSDPLFTGLCAGPWTVVVKDSIGCTNNTLATVTAPPPTIAAFHWAPSVVYVSTPVVQFLNASSSDAVTFNWDFGGIGTSTEHSPTFTFPRTLGATYPVCLEVANIDGCTSSVCRDVEVRDELMVFVPNAFSPDQDGVNDFYGPVFRTTDAVDYEFIIFDRWNRELFSSTDPTERWDGSAGGEIVPAGTYVWLLRYRPDRLSDRNELRGHVTVVR